VGRAKEGCKGATRENKQKRTTMRNNKGVRSTCTPKVEMPLQYVLVLDEDENIEGNYEKVVNKSFPHESSPSTIFSPDS
jgi:hypothetical protein